MKPYFSKLLTEQERVGSKNKSAKWGRRLKYDPDSEYEDECSRVSMSRHGIQYGHDGKSLTDVLSPLRGFLRKNVGKKWNDVYSELCQGLDRRSVSGLHVFQHLWNYVEKDTAMVDGQVYHYWRGGDLLPIEKSYRYEQYYVHPETGVLCQTNRTERWRYKAPSSQCVQEIREGQRYQRIKGIWYFMEFARVDRFNGYNPRWMVTMGRSPWRTRQEVEILKKKQLNHWELQELGLRNVLGANDPEPELVL